MRSPTGGRSPPRPSRSRSPSPQCHNRWRRWNVRSAPPCSSAGRAVCASPTRAARWSPTPTRSSRASTAPRTSWPPSPGLRGGRLRLACFQSAGATLVPRAVAAFHDRHPDVELSMVEAEPDEAQERLAQRRHRPGAGLRLRARARHARRGPGADPPDRRPLRRRARQRPPARRPAAAEAGRPGRRALDRRHRALRLPPDHRARLPRRRLRAQRGLRGRRDHGGAGARGRRRRRHDLPPPGAEPAPPGRGGALARPRRPGAADLGRPAGARATARRPARRCCRS